MSVTVTYNFYSEIVENYMYGKEILHLPDHIIDAIDDYMDGQEFDAFSGGLNPDNFYVNYLMEESVRDLLDLSDDDDVDEIDEERIVEAVIEDRDGHYLGRDGDTVYFA